MDTGDKRKVGKKDMAVAVALGLGAGTTANIANLISSVKLQKNLTVPDDLTDDQVKKIVDDFKLKGKTKLLHRKGGPLDARVVTPKVQKLLSQAEGVKKGELLVISPNNEPILRHELGHARDFSGKGIKARLIARKVIPSAAILGLMNKKVRDKLKESKPTKKPVEFYEKNPVISSMALSTIPFGIIEGKASLSALRGLIKAHGLRKGLAKARPLATGFRTYMTRALPAGLTAGVASKYMINKHKKNKSMNKGDEAMNKIAEYKELIYKEASKGRIVRSAVKNLRGGREGIKGVGKTMERIKSTPKPEPKQLTRAEQLKKDIRDKYVAMRSGYRQAKNISTREINKKIDPIKAKATDIKSKYDKIPKNRTQIDTAIGKEVTKKMDYDKLPNFIKKRYDKGAIERISGETSRRAGQGALSGGIKGFAKGLTRETPALQSAVNKKDQLLKAVNKKMNKGKTTKFIKNNKGLVAGGLGGAGAIGYGLGRSGKKEA